MSHGLARSTAVPARSRRALVLGLIVVTAAAAAGLAVWRPWRAGPAGAKPLELVVSADTAGFIIPCGCTSNQSGGLPRRATYVSALRENADVVVLDAGG